MRKLLLTLKILQKVDNEKRTKQGLKRLGDGYFNAYRLNPYNPLSYIIVIVAIPIHLLLFGIMGSLEGYNNPFKWD